MKKLKYVAMWLMLIAALAYAGGDHDHAGEDHDHAQTEAAEAEDHGHDHAEESDDAHAHGSDEGASVAVTQWTEQMELFMEYPVLVANQQGRFIIHLTILDGFQPVREGKVRLIFVTSDGHSHSFEETELLREGIFAPTIDLHDVGEYKFTLLYEGPLVRDSFHIEDFVVYADAHDIPYSEEVESGDEIGFLKEQQWKIPFATAEAEVREVKRAVWAIGEVLPSPNSYVEIVSPVDGVVHVGESGHIALPGSEVKRGAALATITPPVQGSGWASSHLAYEQAKRDYDRVQRLREKEAISEREYEQVRDDYLALKAGFESFSGGGDPDALVLSAPLSGKIIEWQVSPGQRVSAGDKLMAIVDPATVWLRVNVYENDFVGLGQPVGAFVKSDLATGGWTIGEKDLRVLTTGGAFDPVTRTIPVLLEISNQNERLRIHESTPVELYAADGNNATTVPAGALYEDDGMAVVYIQTGGESFEKRVVTVGPHYNGWVSILRGLAAGERVVVTGGYQVKLASSSAEIGHGHAH